MTPRLEGGGGNNCLKEIELPKSPRAYATHSELLSTILIAMFLTGSRSKSGGIFNRKYRSSNDEYIKMENT